MTKWKQDAIDAPHTQREMDGIPQAMPSENRSVPTFNSDRSHGDGGIGQYRIMVSDTSQYWRERAEKAERELAERELAECRIEQLERAIAERDAVIEAHLALADQAHAELQGEKALADALWVAWQFDGYAPDAVSAYRKARGL